MRVMILVAALMLTACASVQPWEKARLAKDTMKPTGPLPAMAKLDGHIYTSKEAIKGGTGVGGGGCGCN
jgi:hypothetical protein